MGAGSGNVHCGLLRVTSVVNRAEIPMKARIESNLVAARILPAADMPEAALVNSISMKKAYDN